MERRRRFLFRELFKDDFKMWTQSGLAELAPPVHAWIDQRYGQERAFAGMANLINNFIKWSGSGYQSGLLTV